MIDEDKKLKHILKNLPRYSFSVHKKQMEPVTLIILGDKPHITKNLEDAGWYKAAKIGFSTTIKSAFATIFNKSYRTGPMWPAYINGRKHRMGFEKPTESDTYRRRHHMRLWRTRFHWHGKTVWIGTISYDRSVGFMNHNPLPTHHISPGLKNEEDYLAHTLKSLKPIYLRLAAPEKGVINTGDAYVWDGKVLVLNLAGAV
jgi:hypothetical protein